MNITLNTSNYANKNNHKRKSNLTFKSAIPIKSAFLKPFDTAMDSFTTGIAKNYTAPAYSNRLVNWLAGKDNVGQIVDHMQTLGSFVISGMYMLQTLRNQDMDEKRRKTLAINQGLTLLASSAIAYLISEKLVGPWNKHVAAKYAADKLNLSSQQVYDPKTLEEMSAKEKKVFFKKENMRLFEEGLEKHRAKIKALYTEKHPEDAGLKNFKKPNLIHYVEQGLKNETLAGKLKGLDVLKSLIIFGSVYRFLGPVVVTPIANIIGNKLFGDESKNIKQENNAEPQPQPVKEVLLNENKSSLNNFLAGVRKAG